MAIKPPKKPFLVFIAALVLVGFFVLGHSGVSANPAQLYEYYNTGDDGSEGPCAQYWRAQTFTPQEDHKITSVKLKMYRRYSPGNLTVGIRATDGSGHPTGGDLCSGTIDANAFTDTSPGQWYEITLGAGYDLSAGTKYAVVARLSNADCTSVVWWRRHTSGTYPRGDAERSSNSGSSWSSYPYDLMFEEYGEPTIVTSGPTFSLFPPDGSTVSGTFEVTLGLTDLAGKQVSGVDVYLNYDTSKLEAQSISVVGGIFANYPLQTIDPARGIIAINAAATAHTPVTTPGKIATITFKALKTSGSTTLDFDYTAGSTIDSNIVEAGTGTDILTPPPTVVYNFESAGPFTFWLVPVWNRVVWLAQFTTPFTSYSALNHIENACQGSPRAIARRKNGWWESAVLGYGGVAFNLAANNNYYLKVASACQWQPEL